MYINASSKSYDAKETPLQVLIDCKPFLMLLKDILADDAEVNINIMNMGVKEDFYPLGLIYIIRIPI